MTARTTDTLLSLDRPAFEAATQHPWLRLIGQGKLPARAQLAWLEQDRLYALSYVSFIGGLLAKVSIPPAADRTSTLEWRIAATLIDALVGIKRELAMFEEVLHEGFGWGKTGDATTPAEAPTKRYQQLFADASAADTPLLVGLTALWATEKCYLEAWRFAKQQQPQGAQLGHGKDVIRQVLIPNWTSVDFEQFVDALRDFVDEFAAQADTSQGIQAEMESMWRRILDVEREFWPSTDHEQEVHVS